MYATKADLDNTYGVEMMVKISSRTVYNEEVGEYVSEDNPTKRAALIDKALLMGAAMINRELDKCFDLRAIKSAITAGKSFAILNLLNMRYAVAFLKEGGSCSDCKQCVKEVKDLCGTDLQTDDGEEIPSLSTVCSVTPNKDCWDTGTACCYVCSNNPCCCR